MRTLLLAALLALSGCAFIATPQGASVVAAGLGATAALLNLDTAALKIWDERNPPTSQEKP